MLVKAFRKATRRRLYLLILFLITGTVILFHSQGWDTGFGSHTSRETTIVETLPRGIERATTISTERGKTLWELLDLLVVPAALGVGALWFNRRLAKREEEVQEERFQEQALQSYLDTMSNLLLKERLRNRLRNSPEDGEGTPAVVDVAQVRTITILRRVDRKRRDQVLGFLKTSDLVTGSKSLFYGASMADIDLACNNLSDVNLKKADLSNAQLQAAALWRTNLQDACLWKANLELAILGDTELQQAYLKEANLEEAILMRAKLEGASLENANLQNAYLRGAHLRQAYLWKANLKGAELREADLSEAKFDHTTILPDNTCWTPDTDMARFTDPRHSSFWRSDDPMSRAYTGYSHHDGE